MKTGSTAKFVLRLSVTLLTVTSIVALLLAGVNQITANAIEERNREKIQMAIQAVLPGGGESVDFPETPLVSGVYASDAGYAVEVTPVGFDNTITMMVGIDREGKILGIDVVSHTETPSLGAVADADTPAGEAFREQFVGMSGSVAVSKDGGDMDAITGATVTSRAICTGINAALECVAKMG